MNSKDKGLIAETKIAARLLELGYTVLQPMGDNTRYDLVAEKGGEFSRIQCKWACMRRGVLIFNTANTVSRARGREIRKQYTSDEIEFFGIYSPDTQECYLIPVENAPMGHGQLRIAPTKNNQEKNVVWAKNYAL